MELESDIKNMIKYNNFKVFYEALCQVSRILQNNNSIKPKENKIEEDIIGNGKKNSSKEISIIIQY